MLSRQDCCFESACSANDIVGRAPPPTAQHGQLCSASQLTLSAAMSSILFPVSLLIQPHPAVQLTLALTYYYYPDANCTTANCQLQVGFVSSTDGGTTWSP